MKIVDGLSYLQLAFASDSAAMRRAHTIMHASALKTRDLATSPGSIAPRAKISRISQTSSKYTVAISCLTLHTDCTYGELTHVLLQHFTLEDAVSQTFGHV